MNTKKIINSKNSYKNIKRVYDKKFYELLENEVKNILTFQEFINIENTSKDILTHKIDEYARVTHFDGNNFEKTLHFIYSLDLDVDKIGKILKESEYIKYDEVKDIINELGIR